MSRETSMIRSVLEQVSKNDTFVKQKDQEQQKPYSGSKLGSASVSSAYKRFVYNIAVMGESRQENANLI